VLSFPFLFFRFFSYSFLINSVCGVTATHLLYCKRFRVRFPADPLIVLFSLFLLFLRFLYVLKRSDADFTVVSLEVEATIERAERLIDHPGEHVQMLSKWVEDPELGIENGRALRNSPDFVKKTSKQWLGALRDSLRLRFPECDLFQWLATLLEPSALCADVAIADPSYGQVELDKLLDRFANDRKDASGRVVKPLLDRAGCKEQWPIFLRWARQTVVKLKEEKEKKKEEEEKTMQEKKKRKALALKRKEYDANEKKGDGDDGEEERDDEKVSSEENEDEDEETEEQEEVESETKKNPSLRVSMSDLYFALFQNDSVSSLIPAFVLLFELALVLPVTTADCERGFSVMNSLKTDLRASLKNEQLSRLMQIVINGPPVEGLDAHAAAIRWHQRKPRRTEYHAADSVSSQQVSTIPAVVAAVAPMPVRGTDALTGKIDDDVLEVEPPSTTTAGISEHVSAANSSSVGISLTPIASAHAAATIDQSSDAAVKQRPDTHRLTGTWAALFTRKVAGKKRKTTASTTRDETR
jgi:hypothetical protein